MFCDLRTDQVIDALPVDGLGWDDWIGKPGSLRGTIPVTSVNLARRASRLATRRTAVWLETGSEVTWGGILMTRSRAVDDRGRATMPIQAASWESYYDRRLLMDTQIGAGVDQFDIARGLIDYASSAAGGDIGVTIDYATVSGVARDRTYSRYDLPTIRKLLDELVAVENGFEWRISSYRNELGARTKQLVLGYPRITSGSQDTVLSYPGPIQAYELPEDGSTQATHWQSRGASVNRNQASDSTPLMSAVWSNDDLIDAGWPRMDGTSDYSTVETQTVLDAHARADLARARDPQIIPSVTIRTGGVPLPQLGAHVRLRIRDLWFPDGISLRHRVVGRAVTPAARGSVETARLYLEAA
nr:hypothetical protein [Streptomyces sp. SID3343]